jgi:hypothetical protein
MVKTMASWPWRKPKEKIGIRVCGLFKMREIFAWWSSICGRVGNLKEEDNQNTYGLRFLL